MLTRQSLRGNSRGNKAIPEARLSPESWGDGLPTFHSDTHLTQHHCAYVAVSGTRFGDLRSILVFYDLPYSFYMLIMSQ